MTSIGSQSKGNTVTTSPRGFTDGLSEAVILTFKDSSPEVCENSNHSAPFSVLISHESLVDTDSCITPPFEPNANDSSLIAKYLPFCVTSIFAVYVKPSLPNTIDPALSVASSLFSAVTAIVLLASSNWILIQEGLDKTLHSTLLFTDTLLDSPNALKAKFFLSTDSTTPSCTIVILKEVVLPISTFTTDFLVIVLQFGVVANVILYSPSEPVVGSTLIQSQS